MVVAMKVIESRSVLSPWHYQPAATMTTSPTTGNEGGSRGPTSVVTRMVARPYTQTALTPAAPIIGANLSTRMLTVWHQRKAQINCLLHNTSPEMRTTHESTCRIPYDIVETILVHAHLARDLGTLKACSLTCRSWYIVALPHLRHTITLRSVRPSFIGGKLGVTSTRDKLKPVSKLHELGQIPLVREIRVEVSGDMPTWFTPRVFNHRDLRYFSAFANIQTLEFRRLRIDYFIPGVERYFEHFSPTLQSIRLYHPCCTPRQLSHFLSLFPNLDNIEILGVSTHRPTSAIPDGDLVPFSVPTLRGWLVLFGNWVNTFADLIAWCGGLRFRCMHLSYVGSCAPVLFEACAETLETVRFSAGVGLSSRYFCMSLSTDLS